jgi:hypothetical protein
MLKKTSVLVLSSALLLSSVGIASTSANEVSTTTSIVNISAEAQTVSVHDIVPTEYFEAVKGKYKTKEEIREATGFTSQSSVAAKSTQSNEGAIIVDDLDEYAALLTYYSDTTANQNINSPSISLFANTPDSNTATVWGDGLAVGANLSWIEATVFYERNSSNNITKITDTTSALKGFHPGTSWFHNNILTKNSATFYGNTAAIMITGTLNLNIIVDGIGTIQTKQVSHYMALS